MAQSWAEPFAAALALRHEPGLVLLESLPGFGGSGRRSYLAARPAEVATDGIAALDRLGEDWWAGWLSYDLGREIERLPDLGRDDLGLPPLALGRFEAGSSSTTSGGRSRSAATATRLICVQRAARRPRAAPAHAPVGEWHSSLPRPDYEAAVQRAIDYIRAGDVFQVNLSQRLGAEWGGTVRAVRAPARARARRRLRRWSGSGAPT